MPELRRIITSAMDYKNVQGVVLEIDPDWLNTWKIYETYGYPSTENFYFAGYHYRNWRYDYELSKPWVPRKPISKEDFKIFRRNKSYPEEYENDPIVVKICLSPPSSNNVNNQIELFSEKFRIIFETRPPCFLRGNISIERPIVGGISIGDSKKNTGTLGGIVADSNGHYYGITCAHVIESAINNDVYQPSLKDNSKADLIGKVKHYTSLTSSTNISLCNPYNTTSLINELDIALIEIDAHNYAVTQEILGIGKLSSITTVKLLSQGQSVEMVGRSSGQKYLEFGGWVAAYRILDHQSNYYCFKNLIEIKQSGFLRNIYSRPVDSGDSGAWIINDALEWSAMAIAGDRFTGFAIPSEQIETWIQKAIGSNISIN